MGFSVAVDEEVVVVMVVVAGEGERKRVEVSKRAVVGREAGWAGLAGESEGGREGKAEKEGRGPDGEAPC